ncbi:hypothetical protein [Enterocloster clostridioformis]|jgi:hypothetical protein|uniref:Uncharacterized protein n=1 Tax=Enterocloster clostridioformis TaxID=1531 RepID=A0A829W8L4_9FIRM|nr:hypothetical protein [Enterocloster clostridioformis]EHG33514.1 hypothetical protein HMPREF9467_00719 [ [[Clostridium] clostridioforme 2_1_49FAA]ENZ28785.1 hypothetical protein HMPREF1087_01281 [[Clostridium] clostridioforme 90A1]ENZ72391.1 hypothetical protein HMPREF1081_00806 [[Clostridium] clostridioforme 90A4]QIX93852.1 hypothetical protein FOC47_26900 [Enterocloster clostridioformis]GEA37688.1 hypothetical protein Ccl03g_34010 [Enterocloster clostridioformis]
MALKNYLDYDGLLYWKQKFQVWIQTKFALKSDIPTTLPADGGNADTVGGHTVATDVPVNAKFTDTVYSHPANHPASMITEDTTHRFVTDAEHTKYEAAYTHSQVAHAPTNAERNTVVGIQKNGTDVSVDSTTRKANITVPTKVSELSNDSGFQTQSQVNAAISTAIGNVTGMEFVILKAEDYNSNGIPTVAGAVGKIYLVPKTPSETANIYTEWIYANGAFEKIGDTAVDLSGYIQDSDMVPLTNEQIDEIMSTT